LKNFIESDEKNLELFKYSKEFSFRKGSSEEISFASKNDLIIDDHKDKSLKKPKRSITLDELSVSFSHDYDLQNSINFIKCNGPVNSSRDRGLSGGISSLDSFYEEKFIKIRMEIIDTGVGIKKENLDKLFMDFSRLDEHQSMNAQGTGLGLSICKRMLE
jgi:signal transduction histidine kinase